MVTERSNPMGTPSRQEPPPVGEARMRGETDARSANDLARELAEQAATLIRQEIQLAKMELTEKVSRMGRNLAYIAIGGLVAYGGFLALVQAAVNGLGAGIWRENNSRIWLAVWLAPLAIGLIVAGIGYVLVQKGITTLKKESVVPEKTMETMRENKQWLEKQVK